jgi:hypothetical protein
VLCAVLPWNLISGRRDGMKGYAPDRAPRESLMGRGALGKENPAKPPDAALLVQVLWALRE